MPPRKIARLEKAQPEKAAVTDALRKNSWGKVCASVEKHLVGLDTAGLQALCARLHIPVAVVPGEDNREYFLSALRKSMRDIRRA